MNTNLTSEVMTFQSMHGLADLGRKKECERGDMADFATYSTLNLNITHVPVQLISGLCLPVECTPEQLQQFSTTITGKIDNLLVKLQENHHFLPIKDDSGLLRNFTRLQLEINPSSYDTETWKGDVRVGYIISLCFCSVIFILFCLIPNAYIIWKHFRKE